MKAALLVCALSAASCGALGWALEPDPLPTAQVVPAPVTPCRCLDQPATPPSAPAEDPSSSTAAQRVVTGTTGAIGIATGNPVAWNLIGMLVSHVIGAVGSSRRRKATT